MGLDMLIFDENQEEVTYWRKEPAIHDWFRQLADKKGIKYDIFNGVKVPVTIDDVLELQSKILTLDLDLEASGFFFGSNSDMTELEKTHFRTRNLSTIADMLEALGEGHTIHYDSWW